MTVFGELLRHDLGQTRRGTTWWAVGLSALSLVNVAFWPSLEGSDAMEAFEDMGSLLEAFGAQDLATPAGYLDGQLYALMLPALLTGMFVAHVSGRTAGDEDAGRLEVLLTLPVSRPQVWLARWFAELVGLLVAAASTALVVVVTRSVFSLEEVSVGAVAGATLGSAMVGAFAGAVTFAAAGSGATRGRAAGIAAGVVVTSYLMAFVVPLNDDLRGVRSWSPWHWAMGQQPVSDGVDLRLLGALALATAVLVAAGSWSIGRRDVRAG